MTKNAKTTVPDAVRQFLAEIGRKGGKSKSPRKLAALRINQQRATDARRTIVKKS